MNDISCGPSSNVPLRELDDDRGWGSSSASIPGPPPGGRLHFPRPPPNQRVPRVTSADAVIPSSRQYIPSSLLPGRQDSGGFRKGKWGGGRQHRGGHGSRGYHCQQHRDVVNDHLLWLELRRELRSRRVVTNFAAMEVVRRHINNLTNGGHNKCDVGGYGYGKYSGGYSGKDADSEFAKQAHLFRIQNGIRSSSMSHSPWLEGGGGAHHNGKGSSPPVNKIDTSLRSSIANFFDQAGVALMLGDDAVCAGTTGTGGSRHFPSSSSRLNRRGSALDSSQQNLRCGETLLNRQLSLDQLNAEKGAGGTGVGQRVMKNLSDNLQRESGHVRPNHPMELVAEDFLVRASMSLAPTVAGGAGAGAGAGGQAGGQQRRRQRQQHQQDKADLAPGGSNLLGILSSAAHISATAHKEQPYSGGYRSPYSGVVGGDWACCSSEGGYKFNSIGVPFCAGADKAGGASAEGRQQGTFSDKIAEEGHRAALRGRSLSPPSASSTRGIRAPARSSMGYASVVRAFETLREEGRVEGAEISSSPSQEEGGGGPGGRQEGGNDDSGSDLLVGFRRRKGSSTSIVAKTA